MANKFGYKLRAEEIVPSIFNILGLSIVIFLVCLIFSGAFMTSSSGIEFLVGCIFSGLLSIFCYVLYVCRVNRRILYRFSDQLWGIGMIIILLYILMGCHKGILSWDFLSLLFVLPVQGMYFKLREIYRTKKTGIPALPLFYNVMQVGLKVWSVFIPSMITIFIASVAAAIYGMFIVEYYFAALFYIVEYFFAALFYMTPIWLLSVICYLLNFNRSFFDNKLSQKIWAVIYAFSALIVFVYSGTASKNIYWAYIPSTIFFIAQGLYFRLKKDHPDPNSNPEDFK